MSSIWNNRISVSIFGEAHSHTIGVTVEGLPAGEYIDADALAAFMARRTPKACCTEEEIRRNKALPRIISGIHNDRTTGGQLCAFLQNPEPVPADDKNVSPFAQPGHADYTGAVRYKGFSDVKECGEFTDRFAAPLCFAGAVCAQILERRGIYVGAHIAQIHTFKDNPFDKVRISRDAIISVRQKDFPVIHDRKGWAMLEDIQRARESGESLGGIVECAAVNVPAGVGSTLFNGLETNIAQLIFGISGVKGLEFGAGFSSADMIGTQNSDEFYVDDHGHVVTKTNNHGGVMGGISSGMPVTLNVAFKPAAPAQEGLGCASCVVPRAVPCVEAAVDIALLSNMLDYPNFC
ncbi:MAG: chorismate synthase [Ruminococcus sp.]|nr:chorismate synthase [Ruminococcus sp.]